MKQFLAICALIIVGTNSVRAQETEDKNIFNHLVVGATVGTTGWGVELGTNVCPYLGLRVGYEALPHFSVDVDNIYEGRLGLGNYSQHVRDCAAEFGVKEDKIVVDAKSKFRNANARILFDIYPTKKTMFHFTLGAYIGTRDVASMVSDHPYIAGVEAYNAKYAGKTSQGEVMPYLGYYFDDSKTEVYHENGIVEADIRVFKVKPFFGFGVGRTVPHKRVGCMFECGVMYWGKPQLRNGGNDITHFSEVSDIYDITRRIPVYPVLKFRICGRIF